MTREEERIQAAKEFLPNITNSQSILFIAGAEWADEHSRTDIIQKNSISHVRQILVSNFVKIAKKYDGYKISDIPEMKEAFDLVNEFDKCCESVGYKFDINTGRYGDK